MQNGKERISKVCTPIPVYVLLDVFDTPVLLP